jgi:transcriptional regulator with XRE-family HTH domain
MTGTHITNEEFGANVGCDFTMASRLRNGKRLPSRELLESIVSFYHLDANEALAATRGGKEAFAAYLDRTVFNPPAREPNEDEGVKCDKEDGDQEIETP